MTFRDKYNVAVSFTDRSRDVFGDMDFDDYLVQVSAGVALGRGWSADVGYKNHVEENVNNHTIGVLFAKEFAWDTSEN